MDIQSGATIENLVLENYEISGTTGTNIGGLVGYSNSTTITNIRAIGNIILTSTSNYVGGLIGYAYGDWGQARTISQCYTEGKIEASAGTYVGGLIGYATANDSAGKITIENSYSSTNVTGNSNVGGLTGFVWMTDIINTYAMGKVTGSSRIGGLVGYNNGYSTATSSYYDKETTGQSTSALGTGLTTEQAKDPANYTGWADTGAWNLVEGEYPTLK